MARGMRQGYKCFTLSAVLMLTNTIYNELLTLKFLCQLFNFDSVKMGLKLDLKF